METQIRNSPASLSDSRNFRFAEVMEMSEKLRIYLDTNIIYDWFQKKTEELLHGKEFTEIRRVTFIEENLEFLEVYTSFFTLIEIASRLKEDFKLTPDQINRQLRFFVTNYPIQIIKSIKLDDETLKYFLSNISWKDSIQLNIAKNENLSLVTEDEKLHRKGKKFYKEITNFSGLVRRVDRIRIQIKEGAYLLKYF